MFKPGDKRPAGAGRKLGQKNGTTVMFKHAVMNVFERGGGERWLLKWAKRNPTDFFKIAARLIPQEVVGVNGPLYVTMNGVQTTITPATIASMQAEDLQALHHALMRLANAPRALGPLVKEEFDNAGKVQQEPLEGSSERVDDGLTDEEESQDDEDEEQAA